jgi:GTP-binding protein YchF
MVAVPDERLDKLTEMYKPQKTTHAVIEFVDIAGLVKGASKGEGLGNQFLSHIRETDAIIEVVRCFEDSEIIHVENTVDPIRDIEIINLELSIADLEIINNRLEKIKKKAETTKDKDALIEVGALEKAKNALEKNMPLRVISFTDEELQVIKPFCFLTIKPIIYLANVSEESFNDDNEYYQQVLDYANKEGSRAIKISAKLESDLVDYTESERQEMLDMLGIKTSGLDELIKVTYELLGLRTYFTVGSDEVRAWTFKNGMNAKECAGIIHSDFERGFIRAEVMSYDDLIACGSELKVKEAGKFRLEGKDYLMQDGDICHFRFNV